MEQKLHPVQKKILDLITENINDPLSIRAIQEQLDISSPSVVTHHIFQLEKKGYLKRNPNDPRDYQILNGPEKSVAYLNLYGLAYCGPRGSFLDDTPIDRIPIASRLISFPISEAFLVKAKGDSMAPKIESGDLVIAKKTTRPENGSIVVCVNEGETLIKKFQKEKNVNILSSLNSSKYAPFSAAKDFRIVGEVRGVLSYKFY